MTLQDLNAVIAIFFPFDIEKRALKMYPHLAGTQNRPMYEKYFQPPKVTVASEGGNTVYTVSQPTLGINIKFSIKQVEACCGMMFIHHFAAQFGDALTQDQFDTIINGCLAEYEYRIGGAVGQRIIINMIERGVGQTDHLADMSKHVVNEQNIHHKPFWNYFHKYAKKVNVTYMPNVNTGNIILHMEVLTQPGQFKKAK